MSITVDGVTGFSGFTHIGNVQSASLNNQIDLAYNTGWSAVPGFSMNIQPTSLGSNILIDFTVAYGGGNNSGEWHNIFWTLRRNGVSLIEGTASGGQKNSFMGGLYREGYHACLPIRLSYLDSPNTTSPVEYSLWYSCGTYGGGAHRINGAYGVSTSYSGNGVSTMTLYEVKS